MPERIHQAELVPAIFQILHRERVAESVGAGSDVLYSGFGGEADNEIAQAAAGECVPDCLATLGVEEVAVRFLMLRFKVFPHGACALGAVVDYASP